MYKDHPIQLGLTAACKQQMADRMKGIQDPTVVAKMSELEFRPGCRRLTPGDGYLEAFANPNATMTFDPIERITERGVKTVGGDEQEFDMIVCATGFDTSFIPSWKLVGRNGAVLDERWKTDPEAFFAVQVDTMPNYFIFNGPNCPISHGSVLTQVSWTCDYILRWAKKIATEDIKYVPPCAFIAFPGSTDIGQVHRRQARGHGRLQRLRAGVPEAHGLVGRLPQLVQEWEGIRPSHGRLSRLYLALQGLSGKHRRRALQHRVPVEEPVLLFGQRRERS